MHFLLKPLMRLFASLVSRRGDPRPDRDRSGQPILVYPLRPGTQVFFLGCAAFSLYTLAVNLPLLIHGGFHTIHPYQASTGLLLGVLAAIMLSRTLSLGEEGLRLRGLFGSTTLIRFGDLHHVERYSSPTAGRATYFIRSAPHPVTGREQTVTVPEMTYNVDQLLREIRERVPLPELPHRRRRWYAADSSNASNPAGAQLDTPSALLNDPFHLQRFLDAQAPTYAQARAELAAGQKRSHWMWFIFPQMQGLGSSAMAQRFAVSGLAESRAYLGHPVLGPRLRECVALVNGVEGRSLDQIFGYPDDLKFHSSITLFAQAAAGVEEDAVFASALEKYFSGRPDHGTLARL